MTYCPTRPYTRGSHPIMNGALRTAGIARDGPRAVRTGRRWWAGSATADRGGHHTAGVGALKVQRRRQDWRYSAAFGKLPGTPQRPTDEPLLDAEPTPDDDGERPGQGNNPTMKNPSVYEPSIVSSRLIPAANSTGRHKMAYHGRPLAAPARVTGRPARDWVGCADDRGNSHSWCTLMNT
jgi:hypothetical protein